MKGKVAFVLGAAVGYVLGTRAGRERYTQIKRGAQKVWNTAPVQRGVGAVRVAAQDQIDSMKVAAMRAGKGAFSSLLQNNQARGASAPGAGSAGAGAGAGGAGAGGAGAAGSSKPERVESE